MHITNIKKYYFSLIFFPLLFLGTSCVCTTHIKDLTTKNEEIKTIKLGLQHKEKTIADLLDRLSIKDQEIGKFTDEVHTITDLLDRLSMKDQEIGKLTDELHAAQETIEELKSDIEKLREVDVQMEEKKAEVDNRIEETITTSSPEATPEVNSKSTEEQKTE